MGLMPPSGRHQVHDIDYFTLRLTGSDVQETVEQLKLAHAQFDPINPMEYGFLESWIGNKYAENERQERVFSIGASMAIVIACVGLLGLAAFAAEQRTKEIGVRKLLGASAIGIVGLFSRDFLKLVVVAFLIAAPLAYFGMNRWLQGFAYRVDLTWWMFVGAGVIAVLIALLTVGYQSIRIALSNPIDALRYE
jgi:putative ABC transport system permease protein